MGKSKQRKINGMAANTFPFGKPQRFIVFAPIITYILAIILLPNYRKSDNCGDSDLLSISQAFLMPTDSVTENDTKSAFITLIWRSQLGLASTIDFTQSILIQTYYRTNFEYYKKNIKIVNLIRIFKILSTLFFMTANFFNETTYIAKFSLLLFFINYILFCTFDMKLSTSNNRRVLISLFLFILSSILAWYLISRHYIVCDQSAIHLNLSALFQIVCLLSKCSLDSFYLAKYGFI